MNYFEKLKDPRWQKKRLEILDRDEWCCQRCGDNEETLHVHHRIYQYGKEPWEIDNDLLVTLCKDCHDEESTYWKDLGHDAILILKSKFLAHEAHSIINGFANIEIVQSPEVPSSVLEYALSNKTVMLELRDKYFKYLSEASGLKK